MFLLGILIGVAITKLIELLILLYLLKRAFYDSFKDLEQLSSIQEEESYWDNLSSIYEKKDGNRPYYVVKVEQVL